MRRTSKSNHSPIDLTTGDLRAIIEAVESGSALWRIQATCAPGPVHRAGSAKWAYLFWIGPPSTDIVPSLAISRDIGEYRVTIFDPLEFYANGSFEEMHCADILSTIDLVRQIITEAGELALDHAAPDVAALQWSPPQIHRNPGEEPSQRDTELQNIVRTLIYTAVFPS
jgi:hypothetical protein